MIKLRLTLYGPGSPIQTIINPRQIFNQYHNFLKSITLSEATTENLAILNQSILFNIMEEKSSHTLGR